jgi:hypothetical protein
MAKRQKRTPERVRAVFSRMLNAKLDQHQTVLELERDYEPGNMNIPDALINAHIVLGTVPDGAYTLTYNEKSEQVTVRMNTIIWNLEG